MVDLRAREPGVGRGGFTRQLKDLVCSDCGATFQASRADALRCPECKQKALKNQIWAAGQRHLSGVGKGGYERKEREIPCKTCGTPVLAKRVNDVYCDKCREESHRAKARAYEQAKSEWDAIHNPPPEPKCRECGVVLLTRRPDWILLCDACGKAYDRERSRRYEATHHNFCVDCGKPVTRRYSRCHACADKHRIETGSGKGENNGNWIGGRIINHYGYVLVRGTAEGKRYPYTLEHRKVWEDAHGPIPKDWDVHHYDGNRQNNELSNLLACSKSDHHSNRGYIPYEQRILKLVERLKEHGLPID